MPIKFLQHTADIKMQVTGQDLPELFGEAVKGMFKVMKCTVEGVFKPPSPPSRTITIISNDLTSLFIDFLSEVLAQSEINDEVYQEVKFKKLTPTELRAELIGRPLKTKALEIKAVTYHQSEVAKIDDHYEAMVVFDI